MIDQALASLVKSAVREALEEHRQAEQQRAHAADLREAERKVFRPAELAKRWRRSGEYVRQMRVHGFLKVVQPPPSTLFCAQSVYDLEARGLPSLSRNISQPGRTTAKAQPATEA
jgi:hypothetical protein